MTKLLVEAIYKYSNIPSKCKYDFYYDKFYSGGESLHTCRYLDAWNCVDVLIDENDVLEEVNYVKTKVSYYEPNDKGYSSKKRNLEFYTPMESACEVRTFYNNRNKELLSKNDFINAYQNVEIDAIANNFLLAIDNEYMLMPRLIQALYNKHSHIQDNSYYVFESEMVDPKTKIDKQKKSFNIQIRKHLKDITVVMDKFSEIVAEKINYSQDVINAIVWLAIQRAAVRYYSQRWIREIDGCIFTKSSNDIIYDLKKYITTILNLGDVDLTDVKNMSMLTYYIMSVCPEYTTFPSTYLLLQNLIKEIKESLKTNNIREKLLNPKEKTASVYSIADVDIMDGLEFEEFIAFLFSKMGYSTKRTKSSGDQGIDVIAQKNNMIIGIQTKCYGSSVGNAAVQEATAGKNYYGCNKIIVVTNNYFTSAAIELAKVNNVILWDREILKDKINEFLNI